MQEIESTGAAPTPSPSPKPKRKPKAHNDIEAFAPGSRWGTRVIRNHVAGVGYLIVANIALDPASKGAHRINYRFEGTGRTGSSSYITARSRSKFWPSPNEQSALASALTEPFAPPELDLPVPLPVPLVPEEPPYEPAYNDKAESLVEIVDRVTRDVPAKAWEALPDDLAENLDQHLYGPPMPTGVAIEIAPLEVDGWRLGRRAGDEHVLIRDLDLAERLAYARPRTIRALIARMIEGGQIVDVCVRRTVQRTAMPTGGVREVEVAEFWLTRAQALKVSARADTPPADALLDEMIKVFELALDGKLPPAMAPPVPPVPGAFDEERLGRILGAAIASVLPSAIQAGITGALEALRPLLGAGVPAAAPSPAVQAPEAPKALPARGKTVQHLDQAATRLIPRGWKDRRSIADVCTGKLGRQVSPGEVSRALDEVHARGRDPLENIYGSTSKVTRGGVVHEVPHEFFSPGLLDEVYAFIVGDRAAGSLFDEQPVERAEPT